MPWYKSGTVSVTLNSSAVIGSSTAFISNARVGDAFLGPDGAWYEVTNIASDTAMSISPTYKGATNTAGSYALAPMQGYVKDSADSLRALVNTYGAKLAALGTTGNYDILPASKGGTGLTAVGTAVSADVSASSTDKTVGRLLKNGDWGLGGDAVLSNDFNAISATGFYRNSAGDAVGIPAANVTFNVLAIVIGTSQTQWAQDMFAGTPNSSPMYIRAKEGGVWGGWQPLATGGANSNITSLSGLTTALSIAQGGTGNNSGTAAKLAAAAILGTVSQSGGVPTGAIFEKVVNANGEATKFADGRLICTGPIADFTVAAGAVATVSPLGVFPVLFVDTAYTFQAFGSPNTSNDVYGYTRANSKANWSATALFRNGPVAQTIGSGTYLAIGRWF